MKPEIYAGLEPGVKAFVVCKLVPEFTPTTRIERVEAGIHILSKIYGIPEEHFRNPPDRRMMWVEPRSMLFFYLRMCGDTYTGIGREFKRNHCSILNSVKNISARLTFPNSPERTGFIQLLSELGHIPSVIVNTCAGTMYLDEIFESQNYGKFFRLDMARYEVIVNKYNSLALKARMTNTPMPKVTTYATKISENPLSHLYDRKFKIKHNASA
jgi:hypothetical protein